MTAILVLLLSLTPTTIHTPRPIARVVKPLRLPVWPVLNGLALTALDFVGLGELAAQAEVDLGGRVAPMSLEHEDADPFLLLVHHRHRFSPWDPIRPLFRLLLPEGFPAHPHRGFETVTMTMHGGLAHRDSLGVKQRYGDGEVQWLTAGRGVLHEEMWWADREGRAELYQLWLNLPARAKMAEPTIRLFTPCAFQSTRDPLEMEPRVHVLGGEYEGVTAEAPAHDDGRAVQLLRVELPPGGSWSCAVPPSRNVVLYVRLGAILVSDGPQRASNRVGAHHLVYLPARAAAGTDGLELRCAGEGASADVLVLIGEPLREPMAGGGTWVMNSQAELEQADRDYASGKFGVPWSHSIDDDEWRAHLARAGPGRFR